MVCGASLFFARHIGLRFGTAHNGGNASLRVSGHRLEKHRDITERISYLRRQARGAMVDASKPLTRVEVVEISLEVTDVLETTYRAALASSVSPQALERLKAVLAAHLARQGKLDDEPAPLSEDANAEISNMMYRIKVGGCTCLAR